MTQVKDILVPVQELITKLQNENSGVSKDGLNHLLSLYSKIWTEACYGPDSEDTRKFANRLLPDIQALNVELKFKK